MIKWIRCKGLDANGKPVEFVIKLDDEARGIEVDLITNVVTLVEEAIEKNVPIRITEEES